MYRDLFINLAIIISFLAIFGEFYKHPPLKSNRKYQIITGISMGLLGLILMYFSIKITNDTIMDLRNFTIIIAFVFGGVFSGVLVALICSVGRVVLFGITTGSVTAVITFILITIVCSQIVKRNISTFMKFLLMNLGHIIIVFAALIYLIDSMEKLKAALFHYGLISLIGGSIIYYILNYLVQSHENFKKLRLFQKVVETTNQGVFITDKEGKIFFINHGFTKITGFTFDEVKGHNPHILKSGKHDVSFYQKMWDDLAKFGQWQGEIWNKNKAGKDYSELLNISMLKDRSGNPENYVAVFSEVTEMKDTERKLVEANHLLQVLSSIDGLTGIPNRRTFDLILEAEWRSALERKLPLAIIMFDFDYFKRFNDTYGHVKGDECLIKVAAVLSDSVIGTNITVARYGGEEFALILPNQNLEGAASFAEGLRKSIELLNIPHEQSLISNHITISMGVASFVPEQKMNPLQFVHFADIALYKAKECGRNRVETYNYEEYLTTEND